MGVNWVDSVNQYQLQRRCSKPTECHSKKNSKYKIKDKCQCHLVVYCILVSCTTVHVCIPVRLHDMFIHCRLVMKLHWSPAAATLRRDSHVCVCSLDNQSINQSIDQSVSKPTNQSQTVSAHHIIMQHSQCSRCRALWPTHSLPLVSHRLYHSAGPTWRH